MVGIVVVSHSAPLAAGVVELARAMAGDGVPIEAAGGIDEPGALGTDAVRVMEAIARAGDADVLVLMDLGSAVLSAETAVELLGPTRGRVLLCEAPLVEGAVAAAAAARAGADLDGVAREARAGLAGKVAHLGAGGAPPAPPPDPGGEGWATAEAVVRDPVGLHARPAAALVRAAAAHDADVRVRNLSAGTGPADARSLTGLAALAARGGHRLAIAARGPDAERALAAVRSVLDATPAEGGRTPPSTGPPVEAPDRGSVLGGLPSSPGLGGGPARVAAGARQPPPDAAAADPAAEADALRRALRRTAEDLAGLRARASREVGDIIGAQILLLDDVALTGPAEAAIAAGATAARAWHDAAVTAAEVYARLEDPYLRARGADVLDVGRRVVEHLSEGGTARDATGVLVADDLGAADVAALDPRRITALALAGGGPTAHAAIVARALGIPAVTGLGPAILAVADGTALLVDGDAGTLTVAPGAVAAAAHAARARAAAERSARAARRAHEPAVTRDGCVVEVAANVGAPGDLEAAVGGGADGIGLLRSEFLFMGRDQAPGEDEQLAAYRDAALRMAGRRVVLRTLDAGADKPLAYLPTPPEANPFLGVRGIRLALRRPALMIVQLRAALRAAAEAPLAVMFPMIAEAGELRRARSLLEEARTSLADEGLPAGRVEVGAMIEVPAAALMVDAIAAEADFLSIGTNDLVQYVMAAERGNAGVAALADPLHPAVLRLLARVVATGEARGCRIAVCGEAASDAAAVPLLLGLGIDALSVAPRRVAVVKEIVRELHVPECREQVARALELDDAPAVRALVAGGTVAG